MKLFGMDIVVVASVPQDWRIARNHILLTPDEACLALQNEPEMIGAILRDLRDWRVRQ